MSLRDATWSDKAIYACPCGAMYPVEVWRWVDVTARPGLAERNRRHGPFDGRCPSCGAEPTGRAAWLEIDPEARRAVLVLPEQRRGDVIGELQAHLDLLRRRPEAVAPWLMTPALRFAESAEEDTARRRIDEQRAPTSTVQPMAGEVEIEGPSEGSLELRDAQAWTGDEADTEDAPAHEPAVETGDDGLAPGVPQLIGTDTRSPGTLPGPPTSLGAYLGELVVVDGQVIIRVDLDSDRLQMWADAGLEVRPIHLRGRGYPLLGVRLVGAYLGRVGCVDAVVDVGAPLAAQVFRTLAQTFAVQLDLRATGEQPVQRTVEALGMEPNAALCIESARGLLAHGEYPPQEFQNARRALAAESCEERLRPPEATIAPGAYLHVVGAREAIAALAHLDRVSRKDCLSRLLEVEGLPMGEYDTIRRRVLQASLEHGIVAPRRFWRRVVASGLAKDYAEYVEEVARNRVVHEGEEGDLEPDRARAAWEDIVQLCRRKDIPVPEAARSALGLPDDALRGDSPPSRRSAAGEIRAGDDAELGSRLRNPQHRLKAATEVLQGPAGAGDLDLVLGALEDFDTDELLAIMPDLSEVGPRATPGLVAKLGAARREVRQAAVILLGMSLDTDALETLADLLVEEPTNVWLDVARALGGFGPASLRRLCQILRREAGSPREQQSIERVARAMAEIALSDGDIAGGDRGPAHDAVAALADAGDSHVAASARRALATLRDVRESGAAIRGELPLAENTEIRGFARRAYEAIMVPELEVEAEA